MIPPLVFQMSGFSLLVISVAGYILLGTEPSLLVLAGLLLIVLGLFIGESRSLSGGDQ